MKELNMQQPTTAEILLKLLKGAIFSDVTKQDVTKFELNSGASVIGIKGTRFYVYYDDAKKETTVKVVKGIVTVSDSLCNSAEVGDGRMVLSGDESGLGEIWTFDADAEARQMPR